jgi:hypothetical protein
MITWLARAFLEGELTGVLQDEVGLPEPTPTTPGDAGQAREMLAAEIGRLWKGLKELAWISVTVDAVHYLGPLTGEFDAASLELDISTPPPARFWVTADIEWFYACWQVGGADVVPVRLAYNTRNRNRKLREAFQAFAMTLRSQLVGLGATITPSARR